MAALQIFKLASISDDEPVATLHAGEYVFGRGSLLKCDNHRVSRKHGVIIVTDEGATITSTHQNPCFYQAVNRSAITILPKDNPVRLNTGDQFALLADQFWFIIKFIRKESNDSLKVDESSSSKMVSSSFQQQEYRFPTFYTPASSSSKDDEQEKMYTDTSDSDSDYMHFLISKLESISHDTKPPTNKKAQVKKNSAKQTKGNAQAKSTARKSKLKSNDGKQDEENAMQAVLEDLKESINESNPQGRKMKEMLSDEEENHENVDFLISKSINDDNQIKDKSKNSLKRRQGSTSANPIGKKTKGNDEMKEMLSDEEESDEYVSESNNDDQIKDKSKNSHKRKQGSTSANPIGKKTKVNDEEQDIPHEQTDKELLSDEEELNNKDDEINNIEMEASCSRQNNVLGSNVNVGNSTVTQDHQGQKDASNKENNDDEPNQDPNVAGTSGTIKKKPRDRCWYGLNCYRKNNSHLEEYCHPGDSDFETDPEDDRQVCSFGAACYRRSKEHRKAYKHPKNLQRPGDDKKPKKKTKVDTPKKRTTTKKKYNDSFEDDYDMDDPFLNDSGTEYEATTSDEDDSDSDYSAGPEEETKRLLKEAKKFTRGKKKDQNDDDA